MGKKKKKLKKKSLIINTKPESYFYKVIWETARTVKDELSRIRHTKLIEDPFPAHSSYENTKSFFGLNLSISKPKEISIWKAYRIGYDKAYREIEEAIGNKELK